MKKNGIYWKYIRQFTEIEGKAKQPCFKRAGTTTARNMTNPFSGRLEWSGSKHPYGVLPFSRFKFPGVRFYLGHL